MGVIQLGLMIAILCERDCNPVRYEVNLMGEFSCRESYPVSIDGNFI